MSFNVINATKKITKKYKRYLKTTFEFDDKDYEKIFEEALNQDNSFAKGPYLDVSNSFLKGKSVKQLINDGILSNELKKINSIYKIPNLYSHQEEALLKVIKGENIIVSTGTGSGKTECFMIPLLNELMREKENGTLTDGVRALIIYPMNALANDQIDRLRKMLIDYPDISFGCYTGQTLQSDESNHGIKGAIDNYKELNGKRIDDIRLREPIINERLSRDSMIDRPPHILITNYAMLEYLMLRPKDNVFFDGEDAKHWKYIILDEAHTYTGSTGIEVSMLLRRLLYKLNQNIQFILTSATLGDESSNEKVVEFANKLCSVEFKKENIIRGKRINLKMQNIKTELQSNFFLFVDDLISQGYSDDYVIKKIEERYNFNIKENTLNEYLYDLLIEDKTFWKIKNFVNKPKSVFEIKEYINFNDDEISAFVEVASKANKNDSKLFDSRYHMFLKATDGVFITLPPSKKLSLTRKKTIYDLNAEYKVFEAATCKQCHALYIIGYIENGYLEQYSSANSDQIKEAFYIGDKVNDNDEDSLLLEVNEKTEQYLLCPHCGKIEKCNKVHKNMCEHDESHFLKVTKINSNDKKNARVTKCIQCENVNRLGILRGFFSGQEASTSVIGTSLFEEIPSHEKRIIINNEKVDDDFGFGFDYEEKVEEIAKAKQFIAFSDSRQSASYFASYLSLSYDNILNGRLILDTLSEMKEDKCQIIEFVNRISYKMKENKILPFNEYLESLNHQYLKNYDYEKEAWKAMLKELVDNNLRNSLIGMGLIGIDLNDNVLFKDNKTLNLTADDVKNICLQFSLTIFQDTAIEYPKKLQKADIEYFAFNGIEKTYLQDKSADYVRSFVPMNVNKSNKRLDYLLRILKENDPNISLDYTKNILRIIWNHFFESNNNTKAAIMFKDKNNHYKANIANFMIKKDVKWYRCNKCKKITQINVRNVCPTFECDGILEEIDVDKIENNNHYYRLYHDLQIQPMRVVEHTAQLNKKEAYDYQNLFKDQKIDVLSCSTTFEMGVDVGDLETVFMRNMPPSPSNYAQRAGRAGRSKSSAALALTFCNKSNHDFNFFENPIDMISGNIMPPQFKTDNEKICIRHLYSCVFAFFFKKYKEYFDNADTLIGKNSEAYKKLKLFLTEDSKNRNELKEYLKKVIPSTLQEKFEIESFGWLKWFFDENNNYEYPSIAKARKQYIDTIDSLNEAKNDNIKRIQENKAVNNNIINRINNYQNENIINFLSKNNILPKYGFPVDNVELELPNNNDLDLSRDLSMAISEYAPGCQIVANNKLITSRYIKVVKELDWRKYDYVQCDECKTLNVSININKNNNENSSLITCKQCHKPLDKRNIKTFLIPQFGFIAENECSKPSLIKPERTYKTEASFFSYRDSIDENIYDIGNTKIKTTFVSNDGEMVMLNTSDFFVCSTCGYSKEASETSNPYIKTMLLPHKNKDGHRCDTILEKYSLGYTFKTDIIRIKIETPLLSEKKYEEAYSILQALILSTCEELNIDNKEISGCLQYYSDFNSNYSYILYDNTPGGAGHVKRLNDKKIFYRILLKAMNRAQNCPSCDEESSCYSCLRTYQNQKHHDEIKRKYVFNYLGQILNDYKEENSDIIKKQFEKIINNVSDKFYHDINNTLILNFNNNEWKIEKNVYLSLNDNVLYPCNVDYLLTPLNINQRKIAIFIDSYKMHNTNLANDSIKKDAILYSNNFRIWSFSYYDIENYNNKNIEDTFELLFDYLKSNNSENLLISKTNEYIKNVFSKSIKANNITCLDELNYQINILNDNKNIDIINTNNSLQIFLTNNKENIIVYMQDLISKRSYDFIDNWIELLHLCNLLQFNNSFIFVTQRGIDNEFYSILQAYNKERINEEWKDVLTEVFDKKAKEFIHECIKRNIILPTTIGYELDNGMQAELEWDEPKVVFLTSFQIENKNEFIRKGFIVLTDINDLNKNNIKWR